MTKTEAQARAINKYRKNKSKQINLVFYPPDYDLVEYLDSKPNRSGFIKDLIRKAMERQE